MYTIVFTIKEYRRVFNNEKCQRVKGNKNDIHCINVNLIRLNKIMDGSYKFFNKWDRRFSLSIYKQVIEECHQFFILLKVKIR